jgi:hypothetical protein
MEQEGVRFKFDADVWQYKGPAGWWFISLPNTLSEDIRSIFKSEEEGWGRLKVTAQIGNTEWKTAIWYDTKLRCYILPLKAEVRKKEKIELGNTPTTTIWI